MDAACAGTDARGVLWGGLDCASKFPLLKSTKKIAAPSCGNFTRSDCTSWGDVSGEHLYALGSFELLRIISGERRAKVRRRIPYARAGWRVARRREKKRTARFSPT